MRFLSAAWVLAAIISAGAAGSLGAGEPIVPVGSKPELLYTRSDGVKGGLTEGPAVAPDGSIYFTDIRPAGEKGLILRFDPKTRQTAVFSEDSGKANGLMFNAKGLLVACEGSDGGGRRVSLWEVSAKKKETIAERFQGKRFNAPNDLCIDLRGRIYFTDPRYLGAEPRELEHRAVYRIDPDGSVLEITHDVSKPNGIAISPDQKTLFVIDHDNGTDQIDPSAPPPKKGPMKVHAFPLGAEGRVSGPRRTILDFGDEDGCDGMTVDVKGNLYLAARSLSRPGILVVDAAGKELAFIATGPPHQESVSEPVGLPSNCDFGIGEEKNVLYLTVDRSLYRIRLNVKGFHIPWEK